MDRTERSQSEQLERALAGRPPERGQGPANPDELVALANEVRTTLAPAAPTASFKTLSRARLVNRVNHERRAATQRPARGRVSLRRVWQPVLAGLIVAATLLGGGISVAHAAGDSLPGDILYSAKRGFEHVQLALTSNPGRQASLRARFASERLQEAEALVAAGRGAEVNDLLAEYRSEIAAMIELAQRSTDTGRVEGLQRALAAQQQALGRVLEHAGEAGEQAVGAALEDARHSQAVLETLLEGRNPSDLAPGQQDRTPDSPDGGNGHGQGQGGGRWRRTPTPEIP